MQFASNGGECQPFPRSSPSGTVASIVMRRAFGLAGVVLLVCAVVGSPAGAVDDTGAVPVSGEYLPATGDFNGDGFGDIFWYRPGSGTDPIWFGNTRGWSAHTARTTQIYGSYRVVAGDFDGDGIDDLLLHRPEAATDVLWTFDPDGLHTVSTVPSGPDGQPLVGHFDGDERDDIIWYGTGSKPDSIWVATATSFRQRALSVNGVYRPAVGDFDGNGSDDVLWGRATAGNQPLWLSTGVIGTNCAECFTRTSRPFAGNGSIPLAADVDGNGRTDVLWYGPGPGTDALWLATRAGAFTETSLAINGRYLPVVREAFNQDQIVWYNPAGVDLQWYYDGPNGFVREDFPQIGANRVPLVGVHRGPFADEDIFFYGPGSTSDVQTYVDDSAVLRVRS